MVPSLAQFCWREMNCTLNLFILNIYLHDIVKIDLHANFTIHANNANMFVVADNSEDVVNKLNTTTPLLEARTNQNNLNKCNEN